MISTNITLKFDLIFLFLSYRTWSLGESTFLRWNFGMKRWLF